MREMLRRGRTVPGVEEAAVGSIDSVPLNHRRNLNQLILEGRDLRSSDPLLVEASTVSPGYFHLLVSRCSTAVYSLIRTTRMRPWSQSSTRHLRGPGRPTTIPLANASKSAVSAQPLPGPRWLVSLPMRAPNRWRKRMFQRFTSACFKDTGIP